jgi:hypothetical protein
VAGARIIEWVAELFEKAFFKDVEKDVADDAAKKSAGDLAGQAPKFEKTAKLRDMYKYENRTDVPNWTHGDGPVEYLDEAGRQKYLLHEEGGRLYGSDGNPFDTSGAQSLHTGSGNAIFVMDDQGNIYASTRQELHRFHHSSFLAGGDVAGAGELVVQDGTPVMITPRSGHYWPTPEMNQQVIEQLKRMGVDTSKLRIENSW